ncbi:hypothetical protein [Amycolatopsis decaplanina]|uniref:Uncharacterized protein n=1 Tax=Amycolatopsis decaplanina DSM 44594 TaxID=1284240 RepID=M2YTR4_9PSEU|nr:hypothetical protein [Amycolatopsis decaplanina]EME51739.1 hypothetical protein H074_36189 [Amycolatopsis decaplanina DSM 44594]
MSMFWSVSAAAVTVCLIWLFVSHFRRRRRIHLFRGQPYWAALAIVARVRRQRKDEEIEWPSAEPELLDDEPTEVIVLPPQPRPYLEALLPLSQEPRRP